VKRRVFQLDLLAAGNESGRYYLSIGEFVVLVQKMLNNGFLLRSQYNWLFRYGVSFGMTNWINQTPLGSARAPPVFRAWVSRRHPAPRGVNSYWTLARLATTTSTSRHQNLNCN
jgi:hypothetical protein